MCISKLPGRAKREREKSGVFVHLSESLVVSSFSVETKAGGKKPREEKRELTVASFQWCVVACPIVIVLLFVNIFR